MSIKEILIQRGWKVKKKRSSYAYSAQSTYLEHPTNKKIKFRLQPHEFLEGVRTIAKLSEKNLVWDEVNGLIIIDGFIAIKV
jgi:hypothetical protein